MRHLFFCCIHGHLFKGGVEGGRCPIDGWTHEQIGVTASLFYSNPNIGLDGIIGANTDKYLVERIVIVESVMLPVSVECIRIKDYGIDGKIVTSIH